MLTLLFPLYLHSEGSCRVDFSSLATDATRRLEHVPPAHVAIVSYDLEGKERSQFGGEIVSFSQPC